MVRAPESRRVCWFSRVVAALVGLACVFVVNPVVVAAGQPAGEPAANPAAFDNKFREAEGQFARKEYLTAARTWTEAAAHLRADDQENRKGLFDYIAEAYERATGDANDPQLVQEALDALDAYARDFEAAFPGVLLSEKSVTAHANLRKRLAELVEAEQKRETPPESPAPVPTPDPPPRPWKGLAIGSGITAGVGLGMLGLFAGGYVRAKSFEDKFEASMCSTDALAGECQSFYDRGRQANVVSVVGLVAAPVLLTASVTMAVLAARRRSSQRQAFAPVLGPSMVGAIWQTRF